MTRYPDLPVSLDHCGFPTIVEDRENAMGALASLARFEQLHLKVSTHVLDAANSISALREVMDRLVQDFGASRLMWGSDFCQTYDRPYADLVALARRACEGLATRDQEQFLSGTAERLWDRARSETPD